MSLEIDSAMALQFLMYLDEPRQSWTFQTFDDNVDRKGKHLARILNGSLELHLKTLISLNQQGAGIFVTINPTDGHGRRQQNITGVTAVWIEDDDRQLQLPLGPHITVESSPGKHHHYFLLEDATPEDFRTFQDELVANWGSDPNAKDIGRVLRLPGFYHQKFNTKKGLTGEPFMVRIKGGVCHAG